MPDCAFVVFAVVCSGVRPVTVYWRYRWFGNTISGHAGFTEVDVTTHVQNTGPNPGISPQRPVVHPDGTPYYGYVFPNDPRLGDFTGLNTKGTEYDVLHFQSVLGPLSQSAWDQVNADPVNCSQYLPAYGPGDAIRVDTDFGVNGTWDNFRTGFDQSGYVSRFNALMPPATDFQVGDGLNTAGHGWIRRLKGSDSIFGQSVEDSARKAITVKIDHNLNSDHRLSGTYSYEVNSGEQANRTSTWPAEHGGYGNLIDRKPQTFTVNLVSTVRPTLLNEFRVGLSRTASVNWNPLQNPRNGSGLHDTLVGLLGNTGNNPYFPEYNDMPVVVGVGNGGPNTSTGINAGTGTQYHPANATHPWGGQIYTYTWGGRDPRWTFSDTVTWMRGAHSFKGGIEYRWQQSWQRQDGVSGPGVPATPQLVGGVITGYSPQRNLAYTNDYWPNMPQGALDHRRAGENPGTAYIRLLPLRARTLARTIFLPICRDR